MVYPSPSRERRRRRRRRRRDIGGWVVLVRMRTNG
jgi:hypothetical protein